MGKHRVLCPLLVRATGCKEVMLIIVVVLVLVVAVLMLCSVVQVVIRR